MKTWKECCAEAGYDANSSIPELTYIYWAYKNGESKKFDTRSDAVKFSSNIEKVVNPESLLAHITAKQVKNDCTSNAAAIWNIALREEYQKLSQKLFKLCYEKACELSEHYSPGYDGVAEAMVDVVEFALAARYCE